MRAGHPQLLVRRASGRSPSHPQQAISSGRSLRDQAGAISRETAVGIYYLILGSRRVGSARVLPITLVGQEGSGFLSFFGTLAPRCGTARRHRARALPPRSAGPRTGVPLARQGLGIDGSVHAPGLIARAVRPVVEVGRPIPATPQWCAGSRRASTRHTRPFPWLATASDRHESCGQASGATHARLARTPTVRRER